MSYEEARKARARARKDQNLGLILGALSGIGHSIYETNRQSKMDEMAQQKAALDAAMQKRDDAKFEWEQQAARERNQTQIDVARINADHRGESDRVSEFEAEAAGTQDPSEALQALTEKRKGYSFSDSLMKEGEVKDLDTRIKSLRIMEGIQKVQQMRELKRRGGGAPMAPQPVGDLDPNAGSVQKPGANPQMDALRVAGMAGAANAVGGGQPIGGMPMGAGTTPQDMHQQLAWSKLADAYRRFQANPRDISALSTLNEYFGGTLPVPRSMSAMPQPMQRTTTGLGTTTLPR